MCLLSEFFGDVLKEGVLHQAHGRGDAAGEALGACVPVAFNHDPFNAAEDRSGIFGIVEFVTHL